MNLHTMTDLKPDHQTAVSQNVETTPLKSSPLPHTLNAEETLQVFQTTRAGLSDSEVSERQAQWGLNQLPQGKSVGAWQILFNQIKSPLVIILIASGVLAIAVDPSGGFKNGLVILGVVFVNTLIGFVQELKANRDIESISQLVPLLAQVIRQGRAATISATELVPGDLVSLASGDQVPGDLRLIQVKSFRVEEAALTGESVPVEKNVLPSAADASLGDRSGMAYAGTLVTSGTALGVVVATGGRTELGKISHLMSSTAHLDTPLTQSLKKIAHFITIAIVILAAVIMVFGLYRMMTEAQTPFFEALREIFAFSIALAVGAIPEGLPAIVTIALAVGVRRMARRRAVIRTLPSVETLGATTVICSDKTGTLTKNEMTVTSLVLPNFKSCPVSGVGYSAEGSLYVQGLNVDEEQGLQDLLRAGVLCNDSSINWSSKVDGQVEISGDPTELSLLVSAHKFQISYERERQASRRLDVFPFESENQFMATLHEAGDNNIIILKGAPEVILKKCSHFSEDERKRVYQEVSRSAAEGLRVLAFARKQIPNGNRSLSQPLLANHFEFLGFQAMIDPPRKEVIESIRLCQTAGIIVKMITGDHPETAQAIGRELGILKVDQQAVTGAVIEKTDDSSLMTLVQKTNVFARVAPEHKLRLVRSMQKSGHVVAMTGDGVNDAPALKQANIGVAMGITGTSVSKEAADLILTDDNFSSIAAAVEEGRRVFDNLTKSLAFILPTNLSLALLLLYAILFFPFVEGQLQLPMLPAQILWINLVGAVGFALPLAFEAKEPGIMNRKPRDPKVSVLSRFVILRTITVAVLMTAGTLFLFNFEYASKIAEGLSVAQALSKAQSSAITSLIFFQLFYLFNCRSLQHSIFEIGFFSNGKIFYGMAAVLVLQGLLLFFEPLQNLFGTSDLTNQEIILAVFVGFTIVPVITVEKWLLRKGILK